MWIHVARTIKTEAWCVGIVCMMVIVVVEVSALSGPNVCMVKQKYNITKRVKYRAPMSVRTYEWCFSMPPRCSRWSTEMRDLTRLETEERIAEVAVCCPGYKMKEVSCVPICTNGKTGPGCTEDCPPNKWGPNCVNTCKKCKNGFCSRLTGECECVAGWQGESCDVHIPPVTTSTSFEELLTTLSTKTATTNITPRSTTFSTTVTTPKPIISTQIIEINNSESILLPTVPDNFTVETTTDITTTESIPKETTFIIPTTSTTLATTTTTEAPKIKTTTYNTVDETTIFIPSIRIPEVTKFNNNTTTPNVSTLRNVEEKEGVTKRYFHIPDIRKEIQIENSTKTVISAKARPDINVEKTTTESTADLELLTNSKYLNVSKEIFQNNTVKLESTTLKLIPSSPKIKPKEIWIRPAQKGDPPVADVKTKIAHEFFRHRSANNKEILTSITTPKTIIVSIIPTSVSYSTFKRIALTSSYLANKNSTNAPSYNITDNVPSTKSMSAVTDRSQWNINKISDKEIISIIPKITNVTLLPSNSVTSRIPSSKSVTKAMDILKATKLSEINKTNSMLTYNKPTMKSVTESSSETLSTRNDLHRFSITSNIMTTVQLSTEKTTRHFAANRANVTSIKQHPKLNSSKVIEKDINTAKDTKNLTNLTTEGPVDDEEFHILTEPEHITAVMGDKGADRSSVDLISVISIAGGVMMAVITVAVIIVMIERCKKPRYEDIRKINDIRMQVMIDNSEAPPPYVRSIFHTPLPEPPTSERCHYQPISTLDRNLKQFMRPVVVQTISPIMLENFRGILECHYDHLPRRSHDFEAIQMRSSLTPSIKNHNELQKLRTSLTDSTIEAMKCEAKLDVIDNTTSEPLYAEIPCWRPPSEHAVEIINLNGEAVTEL